MLSAILLGFTLGALGATLDAIGISVPLFSYVLIGIAYGLWDVNRGKKSSVDSEEESE